MHLGCGARRDYATAETLDALPLAGLEPLAPLRAAVLAALDEAAA